VEPYSDIRRDTPGLSELESGVRLSIDGLCPSVTLCRPGFSLTEGTGSAVTIGDPELELALHASGTRADAHALLAAPTRAAIQQLLRGSVRIGALWLDGGTLTVDVPTAGFTREHPGLEAAARAMAALAGPLKAPTSVVERLCENLAHDPVPGVRLQNLRALVEAYENRAETRAALMAALSDTDSLVRLEAALAAKAAGRETLVALAVDPAMDPDIGIRALEALGDALPLGRVEPLVQEAEIVPLDQGVRSARVRALIAELGRRSSPDALNLLERLGRDAHQSWGPLVVSTIVAGHRAEAERALIRVLRGEGGRVLPPLSFAVGRDRTHEVIVRELGTIGTVESVPALRAAAQRYGGSIASAARRSVAAIHERLSGSRGQLALTDTEAGRLSNAEDTSGRVTLPDED
jgi:hypothetical protein